MNIVGTSLLGSGLLMSTETSTGFDFTLIVRPVAGLQARFTLGRTDVITRPDFSSFRAFYGAAVKRGAESPALIADAKEVLDSSDFATKPTGARASPWSASWILDYGFARDSWTPLRGVRMTAASGNVSRSGGLPAVINQRRARPPHRC